MVTFRIILKAFLIYWRTLFMIIYPIALLPIFLCNNTAAMRCFYVVALMSGFWVFEIMPMPITSLIPMVLFPLMGVLDTKTTSMCYFKDSNMMFVGGLIIALAIEYCNLHIRISLQAIKLIGCSLRRLNFGLVTLTMFVSMWISNTAAAAMMIPIIEAILKELQEQGIGQMYKEEEPQEEGAEPVAEAEKPPKKPTNLTMCFHISVAYAASIGGLGCVIGSGTNLSFKGIFETEFPGSMEGVSFNRWLMANIPLMLAIMYPSWAWMQFWYMGLWRPNSKDYKAIDVGKEGTDLAKTVLVGKLKDLGPLTFHEILVGLMFILAVILWFFGEPGFMKGWPALITKMQVKDATTAMLVVLLLFALPARYDFIRMFKEDETVRPKAPSPSLITWNYIKNNMHWGLIFLMGSGFAIAEAINHSGLGKLVAQKLEKVTQLDPYAILVITCLLAMSITQFTSNAAVANIILPVVASISRKAGYHPMYLMMPAALSCSFSFCLPVSTPPNAIAAAPCNMSTLEMIKVGLGVQLISFLAIISIFPFLGDLIWHFRVVPDWAKEK